MSKKPDSSTPTGSKKPKTPPASSTKDKEKISVDTPHTKFERASPSASPRPLTPGNAEPESPKSGSSSSSGWQPGKKAAGSDLNANPGGAGQSSSPAPSGVAERRTPMPLVKANTTIEQPVMPKDTIYGQHSDSSPTLQTNSAPIFTQLNPARPSPKPITTIGPLPTSIPSSTSDSPSSSTSITPLRRPTRPGRVNAAGFHSSTLGRKDKRAAIQSTLRHHPTGSHPYSLSTRRTRSKSLPGVPSWLTRRSQADGSHSNNTSTGSLDLPALAGAQLPKAHPHGTPSPLLHTQTPPPHLHYSDSDSDSDDEETSETSSSDSRDLISESHSHHASSASASSSARSKASLTSSHDQSITASSSETEPVTSSPTTKKSSKSKTDSDSKKTKDKEHDKDTEKAKEKSKDKARSATPPTPTTPDTDKSSKRRSAKKEDKDKTSHKTKDKSSASKEKSKSKESPAAEAKKPSTESAATKTSSSKTSDLPRSPRTGSTGRARQNQFITAFDWLKSYAASGQLDQGSDADLTSSSSSDDVTKRGGRSMASSFHLSSTGTGSGDEDEYDEEELHLISDTDDASISADIDLETSAGGFISPLRKPALRTLSTASSSSSSTQSTSSTHRRTHKRVDSDDSESIASKPGQTTNPIAQVLLAVSKGGTAIGNDSILAVAAANIKANKRKTDRPLSRSREAEEEAANKESPTTKKASRRMSARPTRTEAEPETTSRSDSPDPGRRRVNVDKESPKSTKHKKQGSGSSVDSKDSGAASMRVPSKSAKPKFSRSQTVFEDGAGKTKQSKTKTKDLQPDTVAPLASTPLLNTTSSSASSSPKPGSVASPTSTLSPATPNKDSSDQPTTLNGSWKKTPDVVKLRTRSMRGSAGSSMMANADAVESNVSASSTELPEVEDDGIRYTVLPNGVRALYAISLDKMLHSLFRDWAKERASREDFLLVVPFFCSAVHLLDALGNYYNAHAHEDPLPPSKDVPSTPQQAGKSAALFQSSPTLFGADITLQKKIVIFLQDWVKSNFSYFNDTVVLEALFRLLDRLEVAPTQLPSPPLSSKKNATSSPNVTQKSASPNVAHANTTSKLPTLKLGAISPPASPEPGPASPEIKWLERELLMRIVQYKLAGIDPRSLAGLVVRMKHPRFGLRTSALNTASGTLQIFQATEAIKWLKRLQEDTVDTPQASFFKRLQEKIPLPQPVSSRSEKATTPTSTSPAPTPVPSVLEIDNMEVLTQLLKEGMICQVSVKSGRVRTTDTEDPTIKKKKYYTFTVSGSVESNARLMNMQPLQRSPSSGPTDVQTFFLETQPDFFARQLAVLESNLFQRIEPHELHYWLKGDKTKRMRSAPNLNRVIANINRMTAWVSTEIVTTANPKQRIATLKRFILVAQYCLKYKNYQGLLEIMGGLGNTSVSRLSAWRQLPEKYNVMYTKLQQIVNPSQNWKNYRPLIETESSACVPYVGLFLSDLTFIHDGIKSELPDGRLNWKKASRLVTVFLLMRKMQRRAYTFAPDFRILTYLTDELVTVEEKELFVQSRLLEPTRARSGSIV